MSALLFDIDGTMLVSDPIHEAVFREIWDEHDLDVEEDFFLRRILGRMNADIFADFLPDAPDHAAMGERKEAMFRARLPHPFPAMPGLGEVIATAKAQGWGVAAVTNAPRLNAEAMLAAIGLADKIDAIVIGEECEYGKPHPDPYLEAMRQLGQPAEACIAFEDSPSGLRAAQASGATTIGIRSALDDTTLRAAGAQITLSDFTDPALPPLLARLYGDYE